MFAIHQCNKRFRSEILAQNSVFILLTQVSVTLDAFYLGVKNKVDRKIMMKNATSYSIIQNVK